ncbi:MAG: hypothetical protein H6703_16535, partial [Myxococcales bacterium]|nr:hypothetical protein [Myxococcales bacterium]
MTAPATPAPAPEAPARLARAADLGAAAHPAATADLTAADRRARAADLTAADRRARAAGRPLAALTFAALTLTALAAHAGRGTPCADCESCTAALATPGAEVALQGPITAPPGAACVTLRGEGATFDGGRHPITGPGTALRVEAPDAAIRHLRVDGATRGVEIAAPDATLLDVRVTGAQTGIAVERAPGLRLVRATLSGGDTALAFGALTGDRCPDDARLHSPGAVLQTVEITGARVAIAACEAVPALIDTTLTGNRVGLLQGKAPPPPGAQGPAAAGAYDPCVCDPELDVRPGTLLLYSSGCSASELHASYLPDVRAQGHDVLLRETARDAAARTAVFDAHIRRCAPEITDAIGIPGCMPNYACPAGGLVAKRRGDSDELIVDHRLMSADDVSELAARCAAAAARHYGEGCLTHAIRGSTLCGNGEDLRAERPLTGADNRCTAGESLGCAPCDGAAIPAAAIPAAAPAADEAAPPAAPPAPPEPPP